MMVTVMATIQSLTGNRLHTHYDISKQLNTIKSDTTFYILTCKDVCGKFYQLEKVGTTLGLTESLLYFSPYIFSKSI